MKLKFPSSLGLESDAFLDEDKPGWYRFPTVVRMIWNPDQEPISILERHLRSRRALLECSARWSISWIDDDRLMVELQIHESNEWRASMTAPSFYPGHPFDVRNITYWSYAPNEKSTNSD